MAMKYYILDTNFIHLDYYLRGTRITALARSAYKLGHAVLMPQVVYDELCKQYYEKVDELASSFKGVQKNLNKLSLTNDQWADYDFNKLKNDYEQILTQQCANLNIALIKYAPERSLAPSNHMSTQGEGMALNQEDIPAQKMTMPVPSY